MFLNLFLVQCRDTENANRLFSSISNKTQAIYGAMFKGTCQFQICFSQK